MSKYYGTRRAVEDVSFTIASGETVALLGPNGSGKSTLLRCIVGYLAATQGRISVAGQRVGGGNVQLRRLVGYLPENVVLYPDLSVRRYLHFVAGMKGLPRRRRARLVEGAIERCGLGRVVSRPTGALSRGYRQRVGIAQAVLGDPPVLILDEPTVGLDPLQAVELRGLIAGLERCTILLSTHVLGEAKRLCDRVIILNEGRLVAEDTPAALAARLGARTRLCVRLDAPAAAAAEALTALAGVTRLEAQAGRDAADAVYVLHVDESEAAERALVSVVVERGWTLLEMRREEPTLEQLFVELVA